MIRAQSLGEAFAVAKYLTGLAKVRDSLREFEDYPEVQRILLSLRLEEEENGLVKPIEVKSIPSPSPSWVKSNEELEENSSFTSNDWRRTAQEGMEPATKFKLIFGALIVGWILYQLLVHW